MDVDGRSSQQFEFIVERIAKTISSWKFITLSQAVKLILVNSIIVAMTSHVISLYMVPKKILRKITSLSTKFWWATSSDKRPIYWRSRALLEKHVPEGGLGIKNIEHLNTALVGKQAWRIHKNPQLLVSRVITRKIQGLPHYKR